MTNLSDTLAALSEAAEPENLRSMAIVLRQCKVTFGGVEQTSLGKRAATALDQLATAIEAIRTGQLVPVPSVDPLCSALIDRLGYAERVEKAVALLRLLHDESPAAISADDPRLEPFCGDYYPTDTFNALCDIGLIDQIGSADFDDYRAVLLPDGAAVIAAMKGNQ